MGEGMINKIHQLVSSARLDLSDEKRTQNDLAEVFTAHGIAHERECRLSPGDIPDFMIEGLAMEVKLRGARKKDVFKQLERYARHDRVTAIILVTNLTMGLPATLGGKPVYFLALGRAWL